METYSTPKAAFGNPIRTIPEMKIAVKNKGIVKIDRPFSKNELVELATELSKL